MLDIGDDSMANLDQLSRTQLLNVLKELENHLGIKEASERKLQEINIAFNKSEEILRGLKKRRFVYMLIIMFFTFSPLVFSLISVSSSIDTLISNSDSEDTMFYMFELVVGVIIIIAILLIYFFAIRYFRNKTKKERKEVEKRKAGLLAYIPYYENIRRNAEKSILSLRRSYNIHANLAHIGIVSYVRKQLSCYSNLSLVRAVDDFYEIQHREMMLSESQKRNSILTDIQKSNQQFYDSALEKMDESNRIARDISESVDYIRYWK